MSTLSADNHPYFTAGFLSKVNFSWVTAKVKQASRTGFRQEMHNPLMPSEDIYQESPIFDRLFQKSSSLFRLMIKAFGPKGLLILMILFEVILEFSEVLIVYLMATDLKSVSPANPVDPRRLAFFFAAIVLVQYLYQSMETFVTYKIYSRLVSIKNCFAMQIIRQIFKVNVLATDGVSKGNVVNLIQVDCENIQSEGVYIFLSIYSTLILVGCFISGFLLLGLSFLGYILVNVIIASISAFLYSKSTWFTEELMRVRDAKMTLLANVFSNIRFVKFNVMEGFFTRVIAVFRKQELSALRSNFIIFAFVVFFDWFNPSFSLVCLYFTYLKLNKVMSSEVFLSSQQLSSKIYTAFSSFPSILSLVFKFVVMFRRLRQFFDIKPTDKQFLAADNSVKEVAIEIKNAVFSHANQDRALFNKMCDDINEEEFDEAEEPLNENFKLKVEDLVVRQGEVVFVIGKIGAGKSSFVNSLIGELGAAEQSSVVLNGKVTYCPQQPFIMTKTVLENILFYRQFDQQRFDRAVQLAQLKDDLLSFDEREHKLLSEGGMNVSGGQRSRINLARCFYGDADIYLFDDPFSALDVNVSFKIIEEAVIKQLSGKTRIVVTHSIQYLKFADTIIYLDGGQITFKGSFDEFRSTQIYNDLRATLIGDHTQKTKKKRRKQSVTDALITHKVEQPVPKQLSRIEPSVQIPDGLAHLGISRDLTGRQLRLFLKLASRYYGGFTAMFVLVLICSAVYYSYYYGGLFLMDYLATQNGRDEANTNAMLEFGTIMVLPNFLLFIRCFIEAAISLGAGRVLHRMMVIRSLHADLSTFYEKIETGQLLNRFSKDMSVIDSAIAKNLSSFVVSVSMLLVDLYVVASNFTHWLWALLVIYTVIIAYYQSVYATVNKDVVRLEASTKAPILNLVSEIIEGREVISVFGAEEKVLNEMCDRINDNAKNVNFRRALDCWFRVRLINYNLFLVQGLTMLYYVLTIKDMENPNAMVLATSFLFGFVSNIKSVAEMFSNLELDFVSVERCDTFLKVPIERNYINYQTEVTELIRDSEGEKKELRDYLRTKQPNLTDSRFSVEQINRSDFRQTIFTRGSIEFVNISARYPGADSMCLKKVSVKIEAGRKLGIVGKTGSGKSTLIKLLTRALVEREGQVLIDGYEISKFDLKQLRSEMLVINQEIALFEGTIFENMCPEHAGKPADRNFVIKEIASGINIKKDNLEEPLLSPQKSERESLEDEITDCLIRFGFSKEKLAEKGLDYKIQTGGVNLSPGEQQLIAIFRALFTDKKIIILDEATASIDYETESNLIDFFFKRIHNKTLISIAHRLNTVVGCDQIIVMQQGRIVEVGAPSALVKDEQSIFGQMYQKASQGWEFD